MKTTLFTFVLTLIFSVSFAQQSNKADNAILLDYYQSQHYQAAVDYLKKTYPEPVTDTKVLSQLAYASQMANKLTDAEGYYQRVYDIDTTSQDALISMGNINLKRGNNPKAEAFYQRYLLKDTTTALVYKQLARIAGAKNDIAAIGNYLTKANSLDPSDIGVACDLSNFYVSLKLFPQALKVLNKAAESDPENINVVLSTMKLTYGQEKWEETANTCNKLLTAGIVTGDILYKLGVCYYRMKNYACGAETLASISDIKQSEYSYYYAALCYKGLKDYKYSTEVMNKAIFLAISENTYAYYGEIADNNEKLVKYKSAIAAYQKSLEFKGDDPLVYTALAVLYKTNLKDKITARKYYKLAAAAYRKQLQTDQTDADPMDYYTLADLYDTQLKDTANAVKYYRKFLASKPSAKRQQFINYTQSRINHLMVAN